MNTSELIQLVREIVKEAKALKDKHLPLKNIPVNYACIFSQSQAEYDELIATANIMGKIVKTTDKGPLFQLKPLDTISGKLQVLKIRTPDPARPERGDADFTVPNYPAFKKEYLNNPGFKLLVRPDFEMIELMDPQYNVLAYFSSIPQPVQLGIEPAR